MLCLTRDKPIRLPDNDEDDLFDQIYYDDDREEKTVLPPRRPGEDEMQDRLKRLREEVTSAGLDWYIVPSGDEHHSEVVADSDKRREYISNFSGSAGTALIPSSKVDAKAVLFVDSRYWILAEKEVPKKGWKVERVGASGGSGLSAVHGGWVRYVVEQLPDGSKVGVDPKLISDTSAKAIVSELALGETTLKAVKENLVDKIHTPAPRSDSPLTIYPVSLSGESTASKVARLRKVLAARARSDDWIYLLPSLSTIAWLLNYRCAGDIPFLPVAIAYAALTHDTCVIFVDPSKLEDEALKKDWKEAGVETRDYGIDEVEKFVQSYVKNKSDKGDGKSTVRILASRGSSWALVNSCKPAHVQLIECPIQEAKCLKNETELENYRNAYLRDGRAMVRWFAFLEQKLVKEEKKIGEWAAAAVLTRYRRQEDMFAGPAYGDISATGPNAALPHYTPSRGNESVIDLETPYVIDSGPQYEDATIDTTRTWFFGKQPDDYMKRAYTRVLQGHIAASTAIFPANGDAFLLSTLARKPLWDDGLDFGHGLGHGVGNYSDVHEFPAGFNPSFSFKPGHVTTIEPGFYLEDRWGMRIESTYICKGVETKYEFNGPNWLTFEPVTRVPICTNLIDWSIMTKDEQKWVNAHNTMVQEALLPLLQDDLDREARDWLKRVCKPKIIWPW